MDELGVSLKAPIRNYVNESNYEYGIRASAARVFAKAGIRTTVAAMSIENVPSSPTFAPQS